MALKESVSLASDVTWSILKIVLMVVAGIVVVGGLWWMCYVTFYKPVMHPNPTQVQNAQSITNDAYYPEKIDFSLVKVFGWELISHHSYPKLPIVKQSEVPNANTKTTSTDSK